MRVLVIGQGGREHALCWKLAQSTKLSKLYCAPGNPGTSLIAQNLPISGEDLPGLLAFATEQEIDLTVVGPEYPLTLGLVDQFEAKGLKIFGPTQAAARLESSKDFAKEIMNACGVPTAKHLTVTSFESALEYLQKQKGAVVVKADGLMAGKGVFVCKDSIEAISACKFLFSESLAKVVLLEEVLTGREASLIVVCDGERLLPLAPAHDYKRIFDGDQGPNTGGMGTVSPTAHLTLAEERWALENVISPVLRELKLRGIPFRGFLYAGLMIAGGSESPAERIKVLEFNVRLGDPEAQVILPRLDSDLLELLMTFCEQKSELPAVKWSSKFAVSVVLASAGYPESARKGDRIEGLELAGSQQGVVVFQAGTSVDKQGAIYTAGGRVLNVTGLGANLTEARQKAYHAVETISFAGAQYRRDIGLD